MLDELGPAPVGTADLLGRAAARGADPDTATAVLRALLGAGLLHDARSPDRVARRRAGSHVQVRGDGPLALAVSAALSRAGVGAVHVRTSGPVEPPDLLVAGLPARALGRDRSRVAAELVAATAPRTRTAAPGRTPPDLVVLTDAQARRLDEADALTGRAVEHLVVRVRDGRGVVGPLVLPGRTACLRCLDLHRTALDPAWPALVPALAGRTGSAEPGVLAATAALGSVQALLALDGPTTGGPPPPSLDATLELDLDSAAVVTRVWPAHPGCPCGAAAPATDPGSCRAAAGSGDRARPRVRRADMPRGGRQSAARREERRAAVRRAGRAQGRSHEVRAGPERVRGGDPGRVRGAVPGGPGQAAGRGAADAEGRRAPHAHRAVRQHLADPLPGVRRHPGRVGQHRAGAPRGVAGRPRRRGEGAVPGRGGGVALGPAPARPDEQAAAAARARPGAQAADHRAARADGGGARLPRRGHLPARVRRDLRGRRERRRPAGRRLRAEGHGQRVGHRASAVRGHPRRHPRRARRRGHAALGVPLLVPHAGAPAALRPAPGQLPGPRRRPPAGPGLRRGRAAARGHAARARGDDEVRAGVPLGRADDADARRRVRAPGQPPGPGRGDGLPGPVHRAAAHRGVPLQPALDPEPGRAGRRPAQPGGRDGTAAEPAAAVPARAPGDDGDAGHPLPARRARAAARHRRVLAAGAVRRRAPRRRRVGARTRDDAPPGRSGRGVVGVAVSCLDPGCGAGSADRGAVAFGLCPPLGPRGETGPSPARGQAAGPAVLPGLAFGLVLSGSRQSFMDQHGGSLGAVVGRCVGGGGRARCRHELVHRRSPVVIGVLGGLGRAGPGSAAGGQGVGPVALQVGLARTTPRALAGDHPSTLEDLAAPDAPGLGPGQRSVEALGPDRTAGAERLRPLQLVRGLGEPHVGVLAATGQVLPGLRGRAEQAGEHVGGVAAPALGRRHHSALARS
ncbi:hypothetical protein L7F22_065009 [Adiantum nelumboides]|nr:hypothetical protein [Adiantum nelumboides]